MADLKGLKRICMSCGARFYDLNKKPIICPSCNTEFTGEIKVKSRRGRLPADIAGSQVDEETAAEENEDADAIEEIESDEDTVSLDDLDEDSDDSDDDAMDLDGDDLDIDDLDDDDLDDEDIDEDIAEDDEDK